MSLTVRHYIVLALAALGAAATVLHNQGGGELAVVGGVIASLAATVGALLSESVLVGGGK